MSEELSLLTPILVQPAEAVEALAAQVPGPPHAVMPPSAEQVQAADAVFAAQDAESNQVAGLLGLWTGTMLLNDLAHEHFSRPKDESEDDEEEKPSH